jgi:hypothetical protein
MIDNQALYVLNIASANIGNRAGKDTFYSFDTRCDFVLEARSVSLLPQTPIVIF